MPNPRGPSSVTTPTKPRPRGAARPYATYVTAHPSGVTRPTASNLNLVPEQTSPNLVTVVDLAGFYATNRGDRFFPVSPVRAADTRDDGDAVSAGGTRVVDLATRISPLASAAVVNLTGTGATTDTFVTALSDWFDPAARVEPEPRSADRHGQPAATAVAQHVLAIAHDGCR